MLKFLIDLNKVLDIEDGTCCHCYNHRKTKKVNFEDSKNRKGTITLCEKCFEEEFKDLIWLQYFPYELIKKQNGK